MTITIDGNTLTAQGREAGLGFVGELSYQMLGYSAYLVPLVLVVIGWHYFWCRAMDAAYTKLLGATLLFGCISSFLSLAFGTLDVGGKEFRAQIVLASAAGELSRNWLRSVSEIAPEKYGR